MTRASSYGYSLAFLLNTDNLLIYTSSLLYCSSSHIIPKGLFTYLPSLFSFCPRLSSVGLESAVPYPTDGSFATAVEVCQCPPGYTGSSCEVSLQEYILSAFQVPSSLLLINCSKNSLFFFFLSKFRQTNDSVLLKEGTLMYAEKSWPLNRPFKMAFKMLS